MTKVVAAGGENPGKRVLPAPGRAAACRAPVHSCVGCLRASPLPAPPPTALFPPPRRWRGRRVCRCTPLADAQRCGHWAGQRHCAPLARPPRIAVWRGRSRRPRLGSARSVAAHPLQSCCCCVSGAGWRRGGGRCGGGGPRQNPLAPRTGVAAPAPASLGTATARPPANRPVGRGDAAGARRRARAHPPPMASDPAPPPPVARPPRHAAGSRGFCWAAGLCGGVGVRARRALRAGHWRQRQLSAPRHRTVTPHSLQGRARRAQQIHPRWPVSSPPTPRAGAVPPATGHPRLTVWRRGPRRHPPAAALLRPRPASLLPSCGGGFGVGGA